MLKQRPSIVKLMLKQNGKKQSLMVKITSFRAVSKEDSEVNMFTLKTISF